MLKASSSTVLPILHKIFNKVLDTGNFPKIWNIDSLTPIHKKGPKDDTNNYRGISVSSCVGKLFCRILNNRIINFAENNDIFKKEQTGFRKSHRTSDNIFILKTILSKYLYKGSKKIFACFVDFSKAFDSVWQKGLLFKLYSNGIRGKIFNIINDIYTNNQTRVKNLQGLGKLLSPSRGVRQGCSMSPTLFNVFLSDLPESLRGPMLDSPLIDKYPVACLLYADDLMLLSTSASGLQNILHRLDSRWRTMNSCVRVVL